MSMSELQQNRRLAVILAADVAGYSRLMGQDETDTVRTLTEYREVFVEHITRHRGQVVDTAGDSVLATFDSPVEAVGCAVEIQDELAQRNRRLAEDRRMQFRIGINLGDVIAREDKTVYGDTVNIAARLEGLAQPGAITVSGTVFDYVENKLPVAFEFTGEQAVKNIAKPVRAYRVIVETTPDVSPVADKPLTLPDKPSICGWYCRGLDHRVVAYPLDVRHCAQLELRLQGPVTRREAGWAGTGRALCSGGKCAQGRQAGAHQRPADRREHR